MSWTPVTGGLPRKGWVKRTMSNPRARTSASPSLGNMNQSSQAWNNLVSSNYCFCLIWPISKIWQIHSSVFQLDMDSAPPTNRKHYHVPKELNVTSQNVPYCSLCYDRSAFEIAWESLHSFSAMLQTGTYHHTRPRNYRKYCIHGDKRNISKMFQIFAYIVTYPKKIMKICTSVFPIFFLTDKNKPSKRCENITFAVHRR